MTQLLETRWKRDGTDRVFVQTSDGDEVGQLDLLNRTVLIRMPEFRAELGSCLARWVQTA